MGKPKRIKRLSRYGRGAGKEWEKHKAKQKAGLKAKQLQRDMRIIEKTPELNSFYLQRYVEFTKARQTGTRRQLMAIMLTKYFAKQNNIPWR